MSRFLDLLRAYGAEVDAALKRCVDDEDFYKQCIDMFLADSSVEGLGAALKKDDLKAAFEYAHMLKGVVANLSLMPLYDAICSIVEPLRAGIEMDYGPAYQRILEEREKLAALLA